MPRWTASPGRLISKAAVALIAFVALFALTQPSRAEIPPDPIDPNNGEQSLIDLVNSLPINDIQNALNNFPVPFVVIAQAGGAEPVIETQKAGSPKRINADRSKSTGQGGSGQDLQIEVNTELLPTPHLVLDIVRLGGPVFASDLQVIVAFPFDAFNTEDGSAGGDSPNLFFGFATTAAFDGSSYPAGGHAPQSVRFTLTPGVLAGTSHLIDMQIDTAGASNPIRYLAGHFNGAPGASQPDDAIAIAFHTDPAPATINLGLDISASAILSGGTTSGSFIIDWTASAVSKVTFDYLENEDFPFTVPDYGTTVTFDQMPTEEELTIGVDFSIPAITLGHRGNSVIGELTVNHRREDGLDVTLVASQVPTEVDVALDLTGSAQIDVNANTMDFALTATQEGGFPGSDGLFGYPLEFFYLSATDVPDASATWDAPANTFTVQATNPGEHIGSLAFVIDDDARNIDDPEVQLPPDQSALGTGVGVPWDEASRHIFSIVDDGTHGTAAARLSQVISASLNLSAPSLADIASVYTLNLAEPARPLTGYVSLQPPSTLFSESLEATCNVHDFPYGDTTFTLELPPPNVKFGYVTDPPQGIDEVQCFGHVGTLNFDVLAGDLPPTFDFEFDPAGSLSVVAEDGLGGPDTVGLIAARLWDEDGPDGLGAGTAGLFGDVLRDARFRLDSSPSFTGSWSNTATSTGISFDTAGATYLGGAQVAISTEVEFIAQLPAPLGTPHYLDFFDEGEDGPHARLEAGVFGIDSFTYDSSQGGNARALNLDFVSQAARTFSATFDSNFGGSYFPDYDLDLSLVIEDVPASFNVTTDLATTFAYTASSGIDSITLAGTIGLDNEGVEQTTNVDVLIEDAPASVNFAVDPSETGSASLVLASPLGHIRAELWSDTSILKEEYRHVLLDITDVPANWTAGWSPDTPNPHAFVSADQPLGTVSVIVSRGIRDDTPGKYAPFQSGGGAVHYSAYLREIDRRYVRDGIGDADARELSLLGRLDELYTTTAQLDTGEDHLILRKNSDGDIDFLSVQGTGFQCASAQFGPGSFQCVAATVNAEEVNASVLIPVAGDHPFYVALEETADEFTVVQVENIPDSTSAVVGLSRAHVDFSSSAGDVLVYQGGLPSAGETADALKLLLRDTPSFVHANWSLGFPGSVSFDSSGTLEVLLLTQNNSTRTVGAFQVGDLAASWGFDAVTEDEKCQLDPPGCGFYLQFAKVFFNFSATPGLDAFIFSYDRVGSPVALSPAGPAADGGEWAPVVSFLMDNFSVFEASAQIEICYVGICPIGVPLPNIDIQTDLLGSFNVDFWDRGGGPLDILGDPDYFENNPWHLWTPLHSATSHEFPFGP